VRAAGLRDEVYAGLALIAILKHRRALGKGCRGVATGGCHFSQAHNVHASFIPLKPLQQITEALQGSSHGDLVRSAIIMHWLLGKRYSDSAEKSQKSQSSREVFPRQAWRVAPLTLIDHQSRAVAPCRLKVRPHIETTTAQIPPQSLGDRLAGGQSKSARRDFRLLLPPAKARGTRRLWL